MTDFQGFRRGATKPISMFVIGVLVGLGISYLPVFRQGSNDVIQASEENSGVSSRPSTETSCSDHVDNDGDGLVDCDDTEDCENSPSCKHVAVCENAIDANQNGFIDCSECPQGPECN